jgi:hypothetical protein
MVVRLEDTALYGVWCPVDSWEFITTERAFD